jgi:hypothetical protein
MTSMGATCVGTDSYGPRHRLAAYLRRQYRGEHQIKRLAADIGCQDKTAENILASHWPSDTHLGRIVARFGRDVFDAVFGPDIDATAARLAGEIRDLEDQAERKRAHLRQATKPLLSDQGSVPASPPSRPAVGPQLKQRRSQAPVMKRRGR